MSKTKEILEKLEAAGKETTVSAENYETATNIMNNKMETVRNDYHAKDRNSQLSASKVLLK